MSLHLIIAVFEADLGLAIVGATIITVWEIDVRMVIAAACVMY